MECDRKKHCNSFSEYVYAETFFIWLLLWGPWLGKSYFLFISSQGNFGDVSVVSPQPERCTSCVAARQRSSCGLAVCEDVAMKWMKFQNENSLIEAKTEIAVLQLLSHENPHISRFYGAFKSHNHENDLYHVTELGSTVGKDDFRVFGKVPPRSKDYPQYGSSDVRTLIQILADTTPIESYPPPAELRQSTHPGWSWAAWFKICKCMLYQMLDGLSFLHGWGIAHMDIKV